MATQELGIPVYGQNERKSFRQQARTAGENIVNFVRVSPQLHMFSMGVGAVGVEAYNQAANAVAEGDFVRYMGSAVVAMYAAASVLSEESQALENLDNYCRFKRVFANKGIEWYFFGRDVPPFWCTRFAALVAAEDLGQGDEIREVYREKGYSWKDASRSISNRPLRVIYNIYSGKNAK